MKDRKVLILLIFMLIAALTAGCGGNKPGDEAQPSAEAEMVIGIPKVTESFDFYYTPNGFESISMSQVYDTLVIKDKNGETAPSLAERFEISPDGKTYTFFLRENAYFSDGTQFTSADAKFSIDQAMESPYTSWAYAAVNKCEIVDEFTIVIEMKMPNVGFIEYLSNIYYSAMLSENAVTSFAGEYGKSVDKIVGTGPYIVTDWRPGEYVVYKSNPDYFKGEPSIKNVRLKTITDTNAAIIALQTGEIHAYFNDIPGISRTTISNAANLNMVSFPSTIFFNIIMNVEDGPFADLKLRQAVAYAVDRQQMLIVGVEGHGAVADYPGGRQGRTIGDPIIKTWHDVNIEKAIELVKEAGMEGKAVTIKTYASDPYPKLATLLQDALTRIGLKADVQLMERGAFIDEALTKGQYEIGIVRWAAGTKDMDEIMFGSLATDSIGIAGNWSWYSNPAMDELLVKAAGETSPETRKQLYAEAIKIYTEDIPQVPLYYPDGSRAYSTKLVIEEGNVEYDRVFDYSWAN